MHFAVGHGLLAPQPAGPGKRTYRYHQILIGLVALLSILPAAIIVPSSNPGEPDLYPQDY